MAVGTSDKTVWLISLDWEMEWISVQALPEIPSSLCFINVRSLYLHIGLENGVQIWATVDNITGAMSDQRTKFVGDQSVFF